MNLRSALQASVSRFSHLAGFGKVKAKGKAEAEGEDDEDKKKKKDDESAEDDSEEEKMEEDDRDDDESAEEEKDDAGEDDDGDDADDKKKNKKGKKAADDSDDEERCEDDEDKDEKQARAVRRGRRMERERIARILGSSAAARNIELAVSLACETGISSKAAIKTLSKTKTAATSSGRSDRNPRIDTSAAQVPASQAIAASWDRAAQKAGVAPRK